MTHTATKTVAVADHLLFALQMTLHTSLPVEAAVALQLTMEIAALAILKPQTVKSLKKVLMQNVMAQETVAQMETAVVAQAHTAAVQVEDSSLMVPMGKPTVTHLKVDALT